MLVLTRKTGQKLIINDDIEIVILETRGESVKIGVKAPKNVTIYREEIYEEIKKANRQSQSQVNDLDKALNLLVTPKPNSDILSKFKVMSKISLNKPKAE
jgi:carbon storage regulator